MAAVKENSTRNFNKKLSMIACPVTYTMNKIGGHWKPIILYQLMSGPKRYSELRRAIPDITEKMLIQHLKQLQEDELVVRTMQQAMPPVVIYSMTPSGERLTPAMNEMVKWARADMKRASKI
ncbi:MAG: helix-turn-helix domain-containing protein [Chitinophagaceae bacterium]